MIGPARFVNHSCEPNAVYVPSYFQDMKSVKIQLVESVGPGEEILVWYGENYFGEKEIDCKCSAKIHRTSVAECQGSSGLRTTGTSYSIPRISLPSKRLQLPRPRIKRKRVVPKYVDSESSPFSTDLEEDCVP